MSKPVTTKAKLEALKDGREHPLTSADLMYGPVGQVPGPDVRAVLRLARAYDLNAVSVSWDAQARALDYFNAHGLSATLTEAARFEVYRAEQAEDE